MKYDLYDRILGSLVTAGMGDALGVPSEAFSRKEIIDMFGGPIETFLGPDGNVYGKGNIPGEITDDTSQLYEMCKAVIKTKGKLTTEAAVEALYNWKIDFPKYFVRNAGPTMREWFENCQQGKDPLEIAKIGKTYGRGVSNGCAMRVAASGLCNPGDWDGAIRTAVVMTKVSHGTQHAYSGACAIASAIAEAIAENTEISSVVKAAVYGAKKGEEIGLRQARYAYGPRVLPKLLKAIELAYSADNAEQASKLIEDEIGCNGDIQPSVGVAIGLFIANDGDPFNTIKAAVNIGGDTDTFACIAGMVAGAYKGYGALPSNLYPIFKTANPEIDLEWAARELAAIAGGKIGK